MKISEIQKFVRDMLVKDAAVAASGAQVVCADEGDTVYEAAKAEKETTGIIVVVLAPKFTPTSRNAKCAVGVLSDDIIGALFPWLDPQIGASVFGSTDKTLVVHSLAGTKVTFVNGHLTKMPEIYLSPVKTAFGSAEFTGLLGLGKQPGDTDSVYKVESATYSSGAPQPDGITGAQYVGTFGALTIADTQDGWTVTPEIELEPVQTDNLGTVDYTVAGLKVTATCTPLGLTEAQIMAALPITRGRGASMRGTDDLVISGSGALEVTLKNATLVKGPLAWGNTTLRAGQIQFTAHRSFTNGAAGAVWNIGIAS